MRNWTRKPGILAGLALSVGIAQPAQKRSAKASTNPASLSWDQAPRCLDATVGQDDRSSDTRAIRWGSARRDVQTSRGAFGAQLQDEAVVLTFDGQPLRTGSDNEGRPLYLSAWSIDVRGVPDCNAPAYLFIAQKYRGNAADGRWFFDPARTREAADPVVTEFPGRYEADAVLSLRGNVLTITNDIGDRDEKTFQYYPAPLYTFVQKGAQPQFLATIDKPNGDFYANAAASASVRQQAGADLFEALRARTAVGRTRLFKGRYLIVAGATAGDFDRHGAVVVDVISEVSFFVLCEDHPTDTGALVATSRGPIGQIEHGGADVLEAFQFVGFVLRFDEGGQLVCDGECHGERSG